MIQQKFAFPEFARPLFSDVVAMAWTDPRAPMPRLIGDEVLAVEQVSAARAREFGAGRAAAHAAMELLGHVPRPVLQGEDRAPVWPLGLKGSITHTDRDCLAVVTDAPEIVALGLDLEPMSPLEPSLWPVICTSSEMDWLAGLGPSQRGHFAKLIFCAKEAVYKAQYQVSRTMLDFQALELSFDLSAGQFSARFRVDAPGFKAGTLIPGRFAILSNSVFAAVELHAETI